MSPPPPPSATYRLQFHAGFTFDDARRLVPYLHDLGISHIYASPYLRARSGSMHGYDVADPNSLNPELGSQDDYDRLVAELQRHGMGQLVDVVPNHMGIGDPGNYRWLDVLENGPASIYARFFDINWRPVRRQPQDQLKLVVPMLGDQYGKVLENGELSRRVRRAAPSTSPTTTSASRSRPTRYPMLLEDGRERHGGGARPAPRAGPGAGQHPDRAAPPAAAAHARRGRHRGAQSRKGDRQAAPRAAARRPPRRFARARRRRSTRSTARRASRELRRLDALLDEQSYRLAFWRVAAEEINYRRFFDINELAAVRMEDPTVFDDTHRLLLRLVGEGKIQGLRIDHPDGLRDPRRLLPATLAASRCQRARLDANARPRPHASRLLRRRREDPGANERLRRTGPSTARPATTSSTRSTASSSPATTSSSSAPSTSASCARAPSASRDLANSTKKLVMLISLASEVNELGYLLRDIASSDRRHRDFTLNSLTFVIREVIAALGIYRTYIDPETGAASRRRPRGHRAGRRRGQAPQPAHRPVDLRLRRRHAAAARRADAGSATATLQLHRPLPADDRAGDGQGHRGHRLLPLQPPGLAQRGRRRPRPVRPLADGLPPPQRRRARATGRRRCWPARPTTPSAARTCARASTCCPSCRASGERRSRAGRA